MVTKMLEINIKTVLQDESIEKIMYHLIKNVSDSDVFPKTEVNAQCVFEDILNTINKNKHTNIANVIEPIIFLNNLVKTSDLNKEKYDIYSVINLSLSIDNDSILNIITGEINTNYTIKDKIDIVSEIANKYNKEYNFNKDAISKFISVENICKYIIRYLFRNFMEKCTISTDVNNHLSIITGIKFMWKYNENESNTEDFVLCVNSSFYEMFKYYYTRNTYYIDKTTSKKCIKDTKKIYTNHLDEVLKELAPYLKELYK